MLFLEASSLLQNQSRLPARTEGGVQWAMDVPTFSSLNDLFRSGCASQSFFFFFFFCHIPDHVEQTQMRVKRLTTHSQMCSEARMGEPRILQPQDRLGLPSYHSKSSYA